MKTSKIIWLFILLIFLSVRLYAQNGNVKTWEYIGVDTINNKAITKTIPYDLSVYLPFADTFISSELIDSLCADGDVYESKLVKGEDASLIPSPRLIFENSRLILYGGRFDIRLGKKRHEVYQFLLAKNSSIGFTEHLCYELYYIKGYGIVLAVDMIMDSSESYFKSIFFEDRCYKLSSFTSEGKMILTEQEIQEIRQEIKAKR